VAEEESKMSAHDLGIHLPPPSLWPIILAFAITLFFGGWMVHWGVAVAGGLMVLASSFAFAFEPGHSGTEGEREPGRASPRPRTTGAC
jgi:hypothetical protein